MNISLLPLLWCLALAITAVVAVTQNSLGKTPQVRGLVRSRANGPKSDVHPGVVLALGSQRLQTPAMMMTPAPTKRPRRTKPTRKPTRNPSWMRKPSWTRNPNIYRRPTATPSRRPSGQPSSQPESQVCSETSLFENNGHRYILRGHYDLTYQMAVDGASKLPSCCGKAAHLATISDQDEDTHVVQYTGGYGVAWIGFVDTDNAGTFKRITNETVSYTNWNEEPVLGQCAALSTLLNAWYADSCSNGLLTVYEYDCE